MKYCYGLLGYRDDSFWQLEINEYADMVHAVLETKMEAEDRLLHRLAYQVAGIMLSSGNMKRNAKPDELVQSIYAPIISTEEPVVRKPERKSLNRDQAAAFISDLENRLNK